LGGARWSPVGFAALLFVPPGWSAPVDEGDLAELTRAEPVGRAFDFTALDFVALDLVAPDFVALGFVALDLVAPDFVAPDFAVLEGAGLPEPLGMECFEGVAVLMGREETLDVLAPADLVLLEDLDTAGAPDPPGADEDTEVGLAGALVVKPAT